MNPTSNGPSHLGELTTWSVSLKENQVFARQYRPSLMSSVPMSEAMEKLKKTPLCEEHKSLGGRMVPFAGYEMPVQYPTGVIQEHMAVRQNAGLCDVSHMGVATFSGPTVRDFLNRAITRDISKLEAGKAAYTILCYPDGGTVDDLIVYCESNEKFFLVLNASNKEKDLAYFKSLAGANAIEMKDHFETMSLLALQGPKSAQILRELGADTNLDSPFSFFETKLAGISVRIAETGYTGEAGCEIFVESQNAVKLWKLLLEAGTKHGLKPSGLAARDTLRTEMGYSLYGHELSDKINPIEAGLSWAVSLNKGEFAGREALLVAKEKPKRKLVSLKNNSKQAPRPEMRVFDASGKEVGFITSGTFAPSLNYAIGLALVDANSTPPYKVNIRNSPVEFELTKRPFYRRKEE